MNINQFQTKFPELVKADWGIVNECSGFATRDNFSSDNRIILIINVIFSEVRLQSIFLDFKNPLHYTFLLFIHHYSSISTLPKKKGECAQQNRFTGSGLSCDYTETRTKSYLKLLDQGIILNLQ